MIRLGIVGYGHRMACLITGPFKKVEPEFRVVGVVDPAEEKVRGRLRDWGCADQKDVPFYPDMRTLVRKGNLDGILIGTRCNLHAPLAIEAARHDIPVYLEKPVAIDMEQALAIERAYRRAKCEVVVSFPLRVSSLCVRTRQEIQAGAIGHPEHIAAFNYVPYGTVYWQEGYRDFKITQGLFVQKATHDLDYMMHLMNSPVVRVGAMGCYGRVFGGKKRAGLMCSECGEAKTCLESPGNRRRNGAAAGRNPDHPCVFSVDCGSPESGTNEDSSSCLAEFESGAHGIYTQVFYSRRDAARRGAIVSGYKGTISFDWYRNEISLVHHHRPFTDTIKAPGGDSHFGGDDELACDFFDLIRGKTKRSRTPIETGLASIYTCLAAKESAETGKFVKVRQVRL